MEDHSQAYFCWKQAGVRQGWCWHVDAHLDLSREGLDPERLEKLKHCSSPQQAQEQGLCGNPYRPWGGLNCGNYLYPAIQEGLISRLTWVIPPHLPGPLLGSWAQAEVAQWLDLSVSEGLSFQEREGYVEARVLGIPLQIGTLENLPWPEQPILLDIDLDYLIDAQQCPWCQSPCLPPASLTTLAYSVAGGFLPEALRSLAQFWTTPRPPQPMLALDQAAGLLQQRAYAVALELLKPLQDSDALYLRGTCHHHLQQPQQALDCWQRLLQDPQVPSDGQAYLHALTAQTHLQLQQGSWAWECCQKALQLSPLEYRFYWLGAEVLEQLGHLRQASQMLRRAIKLVPGQQVELRLRLALGRLYQRQGKKELARLELSGLERADLSGQWKPLTLLR